MIAAAILPGLAGASQQVSFWILGGVMLLTLAGAGLSWTSMSVRRAHDLGHSGSWTLISPFRAYQLAFLEGEPRDNRYGPPPAESAARPSMAAD